MAREIHAERARKAVGPDRPRYLTGADTDAVMAIVLALMSEVAALRERVDTHERLAAQNRAASPDLIEGFSPDETIEAERRAWRKAYIRRLFRVLTEKVEEARQGGLAAVNEEDAE